MLFTIGALVQVGASNLSLRNPKFLRTYCPTMRIHSHCIIVLRFKPPTHHYYTSRIQNYYTMHKTPQAQTEVFMRRKRLRQVHGCSLANAVNNHKCMCLSMIQAAATQNSMTMDARSRARGPQRSRREHVKVGTHCEFCRSK